MAIRQQVAATLESVLGIDRRLAHAADDTPLLGAIPELDSMAVANVLTALEEQFGFLIEDDEIDGSAFATLGSLVAFVQAKLDAEQRNPLSLPQS